MSVGSIGRVERHKISDLFMVLGTAYLSGNYTPNGEYVAASQLDLDSINHVSMNNSVDGLISCPVLTNRGDSCFRLKLYTAEDTELSGAVDSQIDFAVYGR